MKTKRIIRIGIIIPFLVGAIFLASCSKNDSPNKNETTHAGSDHKDSDTKEVEMVAQQELFQCPMHPTYTSERPGQCPICGMTLVKVEQEPPGSDTGAESADMPPGLAMVNLNEGKRQLIGVRTIEAKRGTLTKTIRASATVKADERRVRQVQSKVQGWIEKLHVNFTGQYVKRGKALMSIYSPDLVSTQEEYLLALRNLEMLQDSEPFIREGAEDLVAAAKRRLRYWDISNSQIRRVADTGKLFKTMTLYSPVKGYVMHMNAVEGMEVKSGMALYTIADLSSVWVMGEVHERDIAQVKVGMIGIFLADAYPGREFEGKVNYVNPDLNPKTRTVMVRIELPNKDLDLKPDMHGDVLLVTEMDDVLTVPPSAVMDNGNVKVVFVLVGEGQYMPREVKIGVRTSKQVQILEGLEEGDKVVVEGNFMIDSESRLRASIPGASTGHQH